MNISYLSMMMCTTNDGTMSCHGTKRHPSSVMTTTAAMTNQVLYLTLLADKNLSGYSNYISYIRSNSFSWNACKNGWLWLA